MAVINGVKRKTRKRTFGKQIVIWGIWYVNITTAGFFTLLLTDKEIPGELVGLTGTIATVIVASYAYKSRGENVAKIESIIPEEEMCIDES
jgi:hypothetical protein